MAVISLDVLLPSWWEIEVTFAAALLVIAVYSLFEKIARLGFCGGSGGGVGKEDDRLFGGDEMAVAKDPLLREYDDKEKVGCRNLFLFIEFCFYFLSRERCSVSIDTNESFWFIII